MPSMQRAKYQNNIDILWHKAPPIFLQQTTISNFASLKQIRHGISLLSWNMNLFFRNLESVAKFVLIVVIGALIVKKA